MILVDTAPLVALLDPRDSLHARARRDLDRVARRALTTCSAVLSETCFLLPHPVHRQRLQRLIVELPIRPIAVSDEAAVWQEVLSWMTRFAEHRPDWADAYLAVLSGHEKSARVWTYDSEFRTTWRKPSGERIPLAVR